MTAQSMIATRKHNRARVLAWFQKHPGGRIGECAEALGLHRDTVARAVKAIREQQRRKAA